MCKLKDIVRYKLLPVQVLSATAQNTPLPIDQTLQDALRIISIESFTVDQVTADPENGFALQSDAAFKAAYLNLFTKEGNVNVIQTMPLTSINRELNAGIRQYFRLPQLNLNASSIKLGDTTGQEANKCYLLGFQYIMAQDVVLLDADEKRMLGL